MKPKLVAKTAVDNSPWKVQRNAPSIPATDVPANLRSMMSCALWRIHESIHRNDENQVFVLTDDTNVRDVAQKLNINVRSTDQLAILLTSLKNAVDLETMGMLEQEFGVRPVKERRSVRTQTTAPPAQNDIDSTSSLSKIEAKAKDEATSSVPMPLTRGLDLSEELGSSKHHLDARDTSLMKSDVLKPPTAELTLGVGSHLSEGTTRISPSEFPDGDIKGDYLAGLENKSATTQSLDRVQTLLVDQPVKAQESVVPTAETLSDVGKAKRTTPPPPAINVWFRSFANALTGKQKAESHKPYEKAKNSPPNSDAYATQPSLPKPAAEHVPHANVPPVSTRSCEEPEDSEEEVVVFQPKRLSAQQKKPAPQHSRPTTPNVQAPSTTTTQSPRSQTMRGQQQAPRPRQHQPRPTDGMSPGQSKAAGSQPPPVIDPDAFGRDFAVNTNSNPRGSVRSMRMRHSPRASLHSMGPSSSRPGSSHRQNRGSSDGSSPRVSPPQIAKTPVHFEGEEGTRPMPMGPGRPSPSPAAETRLQMLNANAPVFQPANSSPIASAPIQPRSAPNPIVAPSQPMPAKQAPIGSGRPSSKSSQVPNGNVNDGQHKPSDGLAPHQANDQQETPSRAAQGIRRQDADFVRQSASSPRLPTPQQAVRSNTQTPPPRPQPTVAVNGRHRGFQAGPRGGRVASRPIAPRPVKPTLFEPELDHTRAFQPNSFEPRKTVTPEVDYVLKSGSTREQTRGKGKLWVG